MLARIDERQWSKGGGPSNSLRPCISRNLIRSMEVAGKAEWNPGRSTVANAGNTHGRRVTVTEEPWTYFE